MLVAITRWVQPFAMRPVVALTYGGLVRRIKINSFRGGSRRTYFNPFNSVKFVAQNQDNAVHEDFEVPCAAPASGAEVLGRTEDVHFVFSVFRIPHHRKPP